MATGRRSRHPLARRITSARAATSSPSASRAVRRGAAANQGRRRRGAPTPQPVVVFVVVVVVGIGAAATGAALVEALAPYLKSADNLFKERAYKKAADIYEELLSTIDKAGLGGASALPAKLVVVPRRLGEIEVLNERPESALKFLERAQRSAPNDVETKLLLSDAHWLAEDHQEAVDATRAALEVMDEKKRPKKYKSVSIKLGLQLFQAGARQEGGGLLTQILQRDQEDPEALQAYGEAALALGQVEDALKIYLRLVVAKSDDATIKRLLARTLKAKDGLKHLADHLAPSKATSSALAFLATVVKDHSGVGEAIALYEQCVEHAPESASYALNLVHLHELHLGYAKAVAALARACEKNPAATVGTLSLAELLAKLPAPDSGELQAAMWAPPTAAAVAAAAAQPAARAPPELPPETGAEALKPEALKPAGTYGEEELDLLALWYTAVKVLFAAGAVELLPPLIALIEPARAVKDLHLTRVRNENAYYCCVAQLATTLPLPLPCLPPLYVMGDSHSLAPAWRTVRFKGEPHLLVPRLVTGCKVWHLREASDFFPKANFEAAVRAIPDGSPVVCIFGEIDCREGLLIAVERKRYPSLEAGVAHTVKIYVGVLKGLAASKRLQVLVHPVPPVLNETRHIVNLFNRELAAAVKRERSLHMLDFYDALLAPGGNALAEGLKLDGTHMHPDYVKLMERSLDELGNVPEALS